MVLLNYYGLSMVLFNLTTLLRQTQPKNSNCWHDLIFAFSYGRFPSESAASHTSEPIEVFGAMASGSDTDH